ncbi:MAG: hypothetical protein ABL930_01525 [Pseudobdellovibrio sp.]
MLGQCETAIKSLDDLTSKDDSDRLLYLMEYGSALQICKDYQKSNRIFLEADKLSEQIDYVSVSRVVGATLINEEMIQYKGDIFEKLFINASAALNYLELERYDEAMVEVRRINEKYNKFSAEEKTSHELNSFAQYLAGLIYENLGKYDDACISYKSAYKLDTSYRNVALDMLTACFRAKRMQEFEGLSKELSLTNEELAFVKRKSKNEKIILYLQGLGPQKAARPENHLYPYFLPVQTLTKEIMINYSDEAEKPNSKMSKAVYSVEKAAINTLEADYNALTGRRLAARVAKEVVADQIRQKDKALGNLALIVMVAAERADLRNWSLLPQTVQVIRFKAAKMSKVKVVGLNKFETESEIFEDIDLSLSPSKKIYFIRGIK